MAGPGLNTILKYNLGDKIDYDVNGRTGKARIASVGIDRDGNVTARAVGRGIEFTIKNGFVSDGR